LFFFSSRRRHTRFSRDWSSDVCSSDLSTLAYFVEKLRNIPEGDGTLLDHSLILYGSNMGNSNQHLHYDVPHVLIGGASGRLKGEIGRASCRDREENSVGERGC